MAIFLKFRGENKKKHLKTTTQRNTTWYNQWDFQGPPILGPLYGKFLILFPYHSHKQTEGPWKSPWFNAILPGNIQVVFSTAVGPQTGSVTGS